MTCPQQRLNKFVECPKVLLLSLPFTDLQLASRMENQWAHKLKKTNNSETSATYCWWKGAGCAAPCGGWALRVIHQYISKGGTLRWLSCSSLASQNHFSKKEPVSCNWNQDLSVAPQQETSLPAAGGVRGPGSVAPQPRLIPSHHEAAPWWGFLPFPLCLHFVSGTLSSVVV